MIFGIGTDIVEIARIESVINRYGDRFISRILHPAEMSVSLTSRDIAKKFCAKEAVSKALGTGMRWPVFWRQIILCRDDMGKPYIETDDALNDWLADRQLKLHVSLSDEKAYVVATVIAEHLPV